MEGWLVKFKKEKNSSLMGILTGAESNKRWFRVIVMPSSELALCYFHRKTDRASQPKGCILLSGVTRIWEDRDTFTLELQSRSMVLKAQSKAEHGLWLQGLAEHCLHADTRSLSKSTPLVKLVNQCSNPFHVCAITCSNQCPDYTIIEFTLD